MSDVIKPMLAYTIEDTSKLSFPAYASVKLDGTRCIVHNGKLYSRSGKRIASSVAQEKFGLDRLNGLDGELIYGQNVFAKDVFQKTTSAVMSKTWPEEFDKNLLSFFVFDKIPEYEGQPYSERYANLVKVLDGAYEFDRITAFAVVQTPVANEQQLLSLEERLLRSGAEGVMVRSMGGIYKHGRSTAKEAIIGKLKRFEDSEAVIVGFQEKMHNANEKKEDAFGYAERSTSKEGLVPTNTLGALIVKDLVTGVVFNIGTGFNEMQRKEIWNSQSIYIGKIVKYKYFAKGVKESTLAPRFPVWLGMRDPSDMS